MDRARAHGVIEALDHAVRNWLTFDQLGIPYGGTLGASDYCAVGVVDRLEVETRALREGTDAELLAFHEVGDIDGYRRYLVRAYGFIAPLERSLLDTAGLERVLDLRRFGKRRLIETDLQTLGMRPLEIESIPQCMWIPWFDNAHTALGWAYVVERNMNATTNQYRHLASTLPGEAAFAATFLKAYAGGQMWQSFTDCLDGATATPDEHDRMVAGARAGYRFLRRWRDTLDGRATSGMQDVPAAEPAGVPDAAVIAADLPDHSTDDDSNAD